MKSSPIIFHVTIIVQDMNTRENKVSWIYQGCVLAKISVLQYAVTLVRYNLRRERIKITYMHDMQLLIPELVNHENYLI